MKELQGDMLKVVESLKRGRAGHAYGGVGDRFMLTIGAPQAVVVAGVSGSITAVGINKDQATDLRDTIDEWLKWLKTQ